MAPPFVACRICRSIEGKLKNYTDNTFLIKAYEEFTGCPFEEWTYLTKFCPECACLIRKVYKFRRKCRKSYKFVAEHLDTGRKITKKFIEMTGSSLYHKPTNLSTWNGYQIMTIDYVHNPKAYKSKKKPPSEVEFHIKHVTVPKDAEAEKPSVVPEPIYDFNHPYYDSSDLEDDMNPPGKRRTNITATAIARLAADYYLHQPTATHTYTSAVSPRYPDTLEPQLPYGSGPARMQAPSAETSVLCEPDMMNEEEDIKMEDDMDYDSLDTTDENLDMKSELDQESELEQDPEFDPEPEIDQEPRLTQEPEMDRLPDLVRAPELYREPVLDREPEIDQAPPEQEVDPDNLTLQEIKAEMLGKTEMEGNIEKDEKNKKIGKKKEKESRLSKKTQQLQVRARRRRSNQELEEHFTITQFLTEEEQVQEFLKRKQSEGYLEGKYKCELCLKSFKEQKWMDAHVKKHEPAAGSHVCTVCQIRSRTPKLHRTHRDCNHTTRYACRRCPFITYSKAQALKHHGWHEGVEHVCQHCGDTFRKHTTYMGHLRRAHPSAHICGYCARSFVSAYGLNLHIKAVHKDINKLENDSTRCEECDVAFVSRQMYVRHLLITDRHKDISKDILGCRKCGEQFETKEEMERHTHYKERKYVRKEAPRRTIKCDECSEVFSHPNGVYQHYLREHPDTPYRFAVRRHYLCEQCGKTFKSPGLLQQHSLLHLGLRPPAVKKPPGRNSCRLCGKTYSKLSGLFRHKLTHLGVRRHKCHICEKAFTDTSNLKQHVQGVHLNIRRRCLFIATSLSSTSTDMRWHKCHICEKAFTDTSNLKQHVQGDHLNIRRIGKRD